MNYNETGEVIVATRVAAASIVPTTVTTFSPSPVSSASDEIKVREHTLSNTTSYNYIDENSSEEYYTNISDVYNIHNNNNNEQKIYQLQRTEQGTHLSKTDHVYFSDANQKHVKYSSFLAERSNINDYIEQREELQPEESGLKKWESELELLSNNADMKLEKKEDKTTAAAPTAKAQEGELELEWQFSFACSLPQKPVIETDEDDEDGDDYDNATDKVHSVTKTNVHIAQHNKSSEMESASSQNATPNSVILASCRTMSSSQTSLVFEGECNVLLNDYDYDCEIDQEFEYIDELCNEHQKNTLLESSNNAADNNNNNNNNNVLANNNVKHSEYFYNEAFQLEHGTNEKNNVRTNTSHTAAKANHNNEMLPQTNEISMQIEKNSTYPLHTSPTQATSLSSQLLSKLEPTEHYHECLLEPEWQYVNNSREEQHDRISRVSDEQLQPRRELIGRGGDRGSCVYRLPTRSIPNTILAEINLLETTNRQINFSSYEEYMNTHLEDNSSRAKELLNEESRYVALKIYPRAMLDNEIEFAEVLYRWEMLHRNRQNHQKLHFDKCDEHQEEVQNTIHFAYTEHEEEEEEIYAARHLVVSYALIMDENNVDCGILMPLYMCNLKAYLCKNGKEECNIMECDLFDRDVCNVGHRHYVINCNDNNYNNNSCSSIDVNSSCGNERSDSVVCIKDCTAKFHKTQVIDNNHNNVNVDGDGSHNSKNEKTNNKRSAFLYKQRYAPIHSMQVIVAICFQLLEAITFMSVSLGTFCNNCNDAHKKEKYEWEEQHDKEIENSWQLRKCLKKQRCTGFIHNDIHVSNILLSESGTVALCDFELVSRNAEDVEHVEHTGYRLPPYARQSPFGLFSASSDTWAFGLIVLNLLTGVDPLFSNTEIMDDFGDGPLLMAYNSQDRRDSVEVLDWEANIKDYVHELLLTSQLSGEIDVNNPTVIALLDVCSLCLINRPNAQPTPPYQLLQHDIFAPFRADLMLAERVVRDWLEHGKQS